MQKFIRKSPASRTMSKGRKTRTMRNKTSMGIRKGTTGDRLEGVHEFVNRSMDYHEDEEIE